MTIYLGLGSNEGDRKDNLQQGLSQLVAAGFRLEKVSPVVESPAMLPDDAPSSWNKPFLNIAIAGEADWLPHEGLSIAKSIESAVGRQPSKRWAPRPLDIDLLVWHGQSILDEQLTIPHVGVTQRPFVLTPLLHLQPDLVVDAKTVLQHSQSIRPIPLWMGIVNVTPDSFSDGGSWFDEVTLSAHLDDLITQQVQILDIGAESTRPRAQSVTPEQEWQRLQPVLELIQEKRRGQIIKPWVSVDSRHPATVERALDYDIDLLNDVTGLQDPHMLALARDSGLPIVSMHSMTVPVDPSVLLPTDRPGLAQMQEWCEKSVESWVRQGLNLNQIVLDPGIGFGKSSIQAFDILQHCQQLREYGCRLLIGHSRKSFMNGFCDDSFADRDMETLGLSLALCSQGVDIIRVHDAVSHVRAYRAWSHTQKPV